MSYTLRINKQERLCLYMENKDKFKQKIKVIQAYMVRNNKKYGETATKSEAATIRYLVNMFYTEVIDRTGVDK